MTQHLEIKSRDRVRDAGEVFTPPHIVSDMIALIPDEAWADLTAPVIEPTCGNGNFIVGIIDKLLSIGLTFEQALIKTFGMDIALDNIAETHCRIYDRYLEGLSRDRQEHCLAILVNNIIQVDDSLCFDPLKQFTAFNDVSDKKRSLRVKVAVQNLANLHSDDTTISYSVLTVRGIKNVNIEKHLV